METESLSVSILSLLRKLGDCKYMQLDPRDLPTSLKVKKYSNRY